MIRHSILAAGLALVAMLLYGSLASRGRTADASVSGKAPYVHVVIFKLKADAPRGTADALVADADTLLRKIPTVRDIRAGKPAEMATPEYAKKDYQVGLVVLFDDYNGLKTYLDHPLHLQYVEKHLQHVELPQLQVFDFVSAKK
jgi:hypothetical protein